MDPKGEQVVEVLAKVAKRDKASIKVEHELTADLGLDSPKQLQVLMDLEERFKIEIEAEDAAKMVTVGDVVNFVTANA